MLELMAEVVLEIMGCMTGHGLLWVLTLGRRKGFEGRDDLATVVGVLFWVGIAVGLVIVLNQ